jgi:hypothetical protein
MEGRQLLSAVPVVPSTTFSQSTPVALNPMAVTQTTGEKPQSKLWNYDGHWFSVMPDKTGTWIWRLDGKTWDHVLQLSTSKSVHADVLSEGNVTHILLLDAANPTGSKLASVEYVSGGQGSYQLWSVRPTLTSASLSGSDETATLAIDSSGVLWIASDVSTTIEVRYSVYPYVSFSAPITIGSGVKTDDISDITTLADGSVGVLWSNQVTKRFYFSVHQAAADPTVWSTPELPAAQSALNVGAGMADDHLHMAVASDDTIYAAVKTSYDKSGYPKMALLIRRPNGVWDPLYEVDSAGTRPVVILDEAINRLMIAYTTTESGGNIVYKETALDKISFSPRITLIKGSLNNVTTTKQNATGQILVMAEGGGKAQSALLEIPVPENNLGLQAFAGTNQSIQLPAGASLIGNVEEDGLPPAAGSVTTQWSQTVGPGTATFTNASALATAVSFNLPGTYVLRLTADDGVNTAFDELTISVAPVVVAAPGPTTVSFQDGSGYSGTRDTTLLSSSATKAQGTKNAITIDGSPDTAGLLQWDISSIPAGSVVQSATITLNITQAKAGAYQIYQVLRGWMESGATWKKASATDNWGSAGALAAADHGTTVLGTLNVTAKGKATITLNAAGIAVVQQWVDNPNSNFGLIFQNYANSNHKLTFDSREAANAANRPKLTLQYSKPLPVLAASAGADQTIGLADVAVLHGTGTYSNAALLPNTAIVTWSVTSGPGTVAFADSTSLDTTATFSQTGDYVLRLTIDDGLQTVFDELAVTVSQPAST